MTKRSDGDPYGCANQPRKGGYYGMTRVYRDNGAYHLTLTFIEDRMSKECRYDQGINDTRCATCEQKHDGAEYDLMIRSQGR